MYQQNYNTLNNMNNNNSYTYTNTRSRSNKNNPRSLVIMAVFLIIMGIFLTVEEADKCRNYNAIVKDGNSEYATVTDVDSKTTTSRRRTGRGRYRKTKKTYYYVTATYTVDKENYTLDFKSESSYDYGETIKIYYEEGNPSNYVREGDSGVGTLVMGAGITVAGVVMGGIGIKKLRKEKELKRMGLL